MYRESNERGRSMVEMLGYMGVLITLLASVGHLVANAFDEYKYSKAYLQLTDLVTSIVKAAAIDADYQEVVAMVNQTATGEDAALKNAEGLKMIPSSYKRIGNDLYHAFGGKVTVSLPPADDEEFDLGFSEEDNDGSNSISDKFAVTFEGLSRKQCIEMALKDWQNNHNIDLYAIIINSRYYWYWPIYTGSIDNSLPVKRSAVAGLTDDDLGQCDSADNSNMIMWIFN